VEIQECHQRDTRDIDGAGSHRVFFFDSCASYSIGRRVGTKAGADGIIPTAYMAVLSLGLTWSIPIAICY